MGELSLILVCISVLIFVLVCVYMMDSNKNEGGYNAYNSTLWVQCDAKEKCDWRFSSSCNTCKHNCGMKTEKNSYVAR